MRVLRAPWRMGKEFRDAGRASRSWLGRGAEVEVWTREEELGTVSAVDDAVDVWEEEELLEVRSFC